MVASPLTSPEGLVYGAGLFGWPFALAFYLASIVLGLVGGWVAAVFERRGWLATQARFAESAPCACSATSLPHMAPGYALSLAAPVLQPSAVGAGCAAAAPVALAASCGCDQTSRD